MTDTQRSIARIMRVNHAGEYGAIRIYGAQIAVARLFLRDLVAPLSELRGHEIEHCMLFKAALHERNARPCRAMWMWSIGGWALGAGTALMGRKSVWACTEVVEENVHRHLSDQLRFLRGKDQALFDTIASIQAEEEGHVLLAKSEKGAENWFTRLIAHPIGWSVEAVIWLSTWGDSARMRRDLAGAQ